MDPVTAVISRAASTIFPPERRECIRSTARYKGAAGTNPRTGAPRVKLDTNMRTGARPLHERRWDLEENAGGSHRRRRRLQEQRTVYLVVLIGVESTIYLDRKSRNIVGVESGGYEWTKHYINTHRRKPK